MQIIHSTAILKTITTLDPLTADLTRIINSKVHSISMRHKNTLTDLYRLTSLDDESFENMAYLQKQREQREEDRQSSLNTEGKDY